MHRPRCNYWGNLKEEDIFREEKPTQSFYDYSDYDSEDVHPDDTPPEALCLQGPPQVASVTDAFVALWEDWLKTAP